jgi:hypothetical protein
MFKRKNDVAAQMADVREKLAEIASAMGVLQKRRGELLLDVDDPSSIASIEKIDQELASHQRTSSIHHQRVAALQSELDAQNRARIAKEQAALIDRIEAKFAERDAHGAELAKHLAAAVKSFRAMMAVNDAILPAWGWTLTDRIVAGLTDPKIIEFTESEIFRIGFSPFIGGTPGKVYRGNFPGAKAPNTPNRHLYLGMPEAVPPMVDALKAASTWASKLMRGGAPALPADAQPIETRATPDQMKPQLSGEKKSAAQIQSTISKVTLGA